MMKCTGVLKQLFIDYANRQQLITLAVNEDVRAEYEKLKDKEKLTVEIKAFRKGRSLNANAYFHVLVGKLAETMKTSKPYMKNLLLQKYGQLAIENNSVVSMIIRDDIDMMERSELHVFPTAKVRIMDDGKLYRVYLLLRGSHTYDSKEMSELIDGTVADCREAGIETITPDELERMKSQWKVDL
jgi:hypothetical protein